MNDRFAVARALCCSHVDWCVVVCVERIGVHDVVVVCFLLAGKIMSQRIRMIGRTVEMIVMNLRSLSTAITL